MSLTYSFSEIMSTRWLKTCCSQSICHQLSSFHYRTYFLQIDIIFLFLTHNPFWLPTSTFYHDREKEKVASLFFFSSPHTHILETYIESCLLYTCARASKLHKQSRERAREREKEEMREISLVLLASTIMMIASSSHTHTHTHGIVSFSSIKSVASHNRSELSSVVDYMHIPIYISIYDKEWKKKREDRSF
jgi:hypothetical protein